MSEVHSFTQKIAILIKKRLCFDTYKSVPVNSFLMKKIFRNSDNFYSYTEINTCIQFHKNAWSTFNKSIQAELVFVILMIRWYKVIEKDAMGSKNIHRGFSDPNMFAAMVRSFQIIGV